MLKHTEMKMQNKLIMHLLVILHACCSCLLLRFCNAIDTLNVNQSIRNPHTLISIGNQNFKFGFFTPVNSSYHYVGVMYNIPILTVIWVANRNKPLNDSNGTIEISSAGHLVVFDGKRELVWQSSHSRRSSTSSPANVSAHLLDTGNLVLQDNDDNCTKFWESFVHASDSFVSNMRMLTDLTRPADIHRDRLTSWRSPFDPAPGSFKYTIEPLDVPQAFIWNGSSPYWRSGPWNGQVFTGLPSMKSSYGRRFGVEIDEPGKAYATWTLSNTSIIIYYELSSSGMLLMKEWDPEVSTDWEVSWTSQETACDVYGRCGAFASCDATRRKGRICNCFPGFEPENREEWDARNWTGGCIRRTPLVCDGNTTHEDGFLHVKNVKLPDHFNWYPLQTAGACWNQCLNNCSCIAYAYEDGIGCVLWWTKGLIDVQKFSTGEGSNLYIRLPHSEIEKLTKGRKTTFIATVVVSSITTPVCAYFLWKMFLHYRGRRNHRRDTCLRRKKTADKDTGLADNAYKVQIEELPLFKFEMLSKATQNFNPINKLGQGGFGPVYKGKLQNEQVIAIKRLSTSSNQGVEEFMNEVVVISMLQHRNLVNLIGCCVEHEEKMLVYEYMPNGSLDAHLFDLDKRHLLDWERRVMIIEGICRGLLYLHRDSRQRIIHRDLKASNILLDEELNPKISDFGMARIFGGKQDQANTARVVGTYGYMAPEYAIEGRFSEKSDVYSFGVMLLEIISGRKNTSFYDHEEQGPSLIAYAWKLWNEGSIMDIMDVSMKYDPVEMKGEVVRFIHVGLLCVQEEAKKRPTTSTLLSMLNSD